MTGWVLILMLSITTGSLATTTATFEDEAACWAAGEAVVKQRPYYNVVAAYVCTPSRTTK